ncbi:ATP-binding cassette domain-containing protein, partial [bacterium]|nr:ATP-binding cassette domain-containing protein [bacterium]
DDYQERVIDLMRLVGLEERWNHKPDQLSGGEQQRVSIARALITRPAILLADEPTGNLDSKNGNAVMELLRRSADELGQTIVMVTHDPRAAAYADRAVFLRDGKVVRQVALEKDAALPQRVRAIMDAMEELEI